MPFHRITHPLALHKLSYMRNNVVNCPARIFTNLMREIGMIMAIEVMREIYTTILYKTVHVSNNVHFEGEFLGEKKPVLVPILRSGLLMAEGMQDVISTNNIGHIGIYHDEINDHVIKYLSALPKNNKDRDFFLIDPVIATGATASLAIQTLKMYEVPDNRIKFIALMIGTQGQERLNTDHSEISVFGLKIGEEMVGKRILHGLGSVSGRLFHTI